MTVYDVVDNLTRIEISGDDSVILLNRLKNSATEAETKSSLNSRSEMLAMCRHKNKFLLKNTK